MIIEVLVCKPDGTQAFESREVLDDWFKAGEEIPEHTREAAEIGGINTKRPPRISVGGAVLLACFC